MRLLVFGGWGQLGADLALLAAERGHDLVRPRHADTDVTDAGAVRDAVSRAAPVKAVVNAAAFHKVEACEAEPGSALAVNAAAALLVARAATEAGARAVFVSSDYVFDGERSAGYAEEDQVHPINVYGVSKAAGERLTLLGCPRGVVVRGSGMFGLAGSSGKGGNFVEAMLGKAREGLEIRVVDDLVFAPTCTRDMAERILMLLELDAPAGPYHLANAGVCSWFELARKTFELAGIEADLSPAASDHVGVRRPRYSVLLDTKTRGVGLPPARRWEDALAWYLDTRAARDGTIVAPGERPA